MLRKSIAITALLLLTICFNSCKDDENVNLTTGLDKLVLVTNITSASPVIGYVGTLKDLDVGSYTNINARQSAQYPFITLFKNDVFVIPNKGGDILKKYTRQVGGTLVESGSITLPASSQSINVVVESETKAYCSLQNAGKILVFNPSTMTIINYIDITDYALGGDGSPDPTIMVLRDDKLYVACVQTSDGYTSSYPAQVLIIDLKNSNTITSATDSRSTWAGSIDEPNSMFFDEKGDLYLFCVASYGFGGASQKCGFLRIKRGETTFDASYFFNVADHVIAEIPGNKVDYLQHMHYTTNGIVYSTGNIYALASNPPNYITDRTYGSFKVDILNKTIVKIDLPYSNGYAASVWPYENKILWGLATTTGVGIYTYDPVTNTASVSPVVTTQGDPSAIQSFN